MSTGNSAVNLNNIAGSFIIEGLTEQQELTPLEGMSLDLDESDDDSTPGSDDSTPGSVSETPDSNREPDINNNGNHMQILKELHESDLIGNPEEVRFFDGDDNPIDLEQLPLKEALRHLLEDRIENIKKDHADVSRASDFTRRLLEIESNGGDSRSLIHYFQTVQLPAKEIDISGENGQRQMIAHFRSLKGDDPESAEIYIDALRSKGKLKEYAEKARELLEQDEARQIEQSRKEGEQRAAAEKEFQQKYRSSLDAELKKRFQTNDAKRKRIIDFSTGKDKDGSYEVYKAFFHAMQKPETAVDLVYFLADREGYLRQMAGKEVSTAKAQIIKKVIIAKKNRSDSSSDDSTPNGETVFSIDGVHDSLR
jgi:hypothetical protein